jgi:MFS family permease
LLELTSFTIYVLKKIYRKSIFFASTEGLRLEADFKCIDSNYSHSCRCRIYYSLYQSFFSISTWHRLKSILSHRVFSFVLVAIMLVFVPFIQRHYGYRTAIVTFQGLAILALFVMASTEWYSSFSFAMPIAVIAYLLRQPLMNVAGPSTSELSLNYVGERNQEILSALQAAIWSGSWFISSVIFGWMRSLDISYVNIFMITVLLYIVATFWYLRLISQYEKMKIS